jgi:hypothetical protein
LRRDRLADTERDIAAVLTDARALRPDVTRTTVKEAKRDLKHTLDQLERVVAATR